MSHPSVTQVVAHIVTYNHEDCIGAALRSLIEHRCALAPHGYHLRIVVTDNCSMDDTVPLIEHSFPEVELRKNRSNDGFSAAHNALFLESDEPFVCIINPDTVLAPECVRIMIETIKEDPRAGIVTPKLLRCAEDLSPVSPPIIDAAGMFITPSIRHFDRGSGERDSGQYDHQEYVFGATGALALFRREFLDDIALQGEVFDTHFFAYREDADLSWRAQYLGWRVVYEPRAVAYHRRKVLPERRKALSGAINRLGVQNRFLLQLKNLTWGANARCIPSLLGRNLIVIGAVLLHERSSLPALLAVGKLFSEMRRKRRDSLKRARVASLEVGRWFWKKSEPALIRDRAPRPIKKVLAVIINYNSGEFAARAVEAICASRRTHLDSKNPLENFSGATHRESWPTPQGAPPDDFTLQVVVFDNASSDGSVDRIPTRPNLQIIRSPLNLGFAGAINRGVEGSDAEAFLILNPDVEISPDTVEYLAQTLDEYSQLGALSPILRSRDGSAQLGFVARRLPSWWVTALEGLGGHRLFPHNPWSACYRMTDDQFLTEYANKSSATNPPYDDRARPFLVEQPAGACVLIRREAFTELCGFDERFLPAWFEDVDFFKRLSKTRWRAALLGSVSAVHEGGHTTKSMSRVHFSTLFVMNQLRYWHKHGTTVGFLLLRLILPLGFLLRNGTKAHSFKGVLDLLRFQEDSKKATVHRSGSEKPSSLEAS